MSNLIAEAINLVLYNNKMYIGYFTHADYLIMYCQLDIDSNVKSEGIILKIIIPSTFKNSNSNNIVFPSMHIIPKEYFLSI